MGAGESERNLIPADASQEAIAEYLAEPLEVSVSAVSVPLPEKIKAGKKAYNRRGFGYGGEDAYFYSWGLKCAPPPAPHVHFFCPQAGETGWGEGGAQMVALKSWRVLVQR